MVKIDNSSFITIDICLYTTTISARNIMKYHFKYPERDMKAALRDAGVVRLSITLMTALQSVRVGVARAKIKLTTFGCRKRIDLSTRIPCNRHLGLIANLGCGVTLRLHVLNYYLYVYLVLHTKL